MKNKLLLLCSLLLLLTVGLASAATDVDVGVSVVGDANLSVSCEASGTCSVNILGEPFEAMNSRWLKDNDLGRNGVAKMVATATGCMLGVDEIFGIHPNCKSKSNSVMMGSFDLLFKNYLSPVVQQLDFVAQRQDRIIVQQRMLMSHFGVGFNETIVDRETLKETSRRTGLPVLTSDGYTCEFINDLFVCTGAVV